MAKVTMNEGTPEASADKPAALTDDMIEDAKGRILTIKTIDILYESRLSRMVGADAAANAPYMVGYVFPTAMVVAIDGDDLPMLNSQREIDARIQQLGRDGITAVMMHFQAQAMLEQEAGLKNSAGAKDSDKPAGS